MNKSASTGFEALLNSYNYHFPEKLIAQAPVSPRDSAKLLVYNRAENKITHSVFKDLVDFLPKDGVLVFNQTKVVPARLEVYKPTGGKVKLLYIKHDSKQVWFITDRKLAVGESLNFKANLKSEFSLKILAQQEQFFVMKPSFKISEIFATLDKFGQTPLPPYIKNSPLKGAKLKNEYQTVFAKTQGSVAAPTASLHFTKSLLNKIEKYGVTIKYVTLHVNLGTFASLTEDQVKQGKLHEECFTIDSPTAKFLNKAKAEGRPIIAVGTTAVRALESASDTKGKLTNLRGTTDIFITEQTKLKFVDQLITNFHVPKSSLLMLVASLTGRGPLMHIYQKAVTKKYRLFSFGDGMYVK